MLTGVRSTCTLDRHPTPTELHSLTVDPDVTVEVIELLGGQVKLDIRWVVPHDSLDSLDELHWRRAEQRKRIEKLWGTSSAQ